MSIEMRKDGAVAVVTITQPAKKNALSFEMRKALAARFRELADDDSVRAVVLTGAGDAFCSGADVEAMGGRDLPSARSRMLHLHAMIRAVHGIDKPVIAAVRGAAAGVGLSLALACDFVLAGESARFAPVFSRIGLAPDGGAVWFLARHIGFAQAKELVYNARILDARQALALGLAQQVMPDATLLDEALAQAHGYAQGPSFALALTKQMFAGCVSPSLDQFLELELLMQPQLTQTRDHAEGTAAFREKRKPAFVGR
jgi:2-(1,2-epoxy-1,2-dihydrophenyl)acetyl-CoA isomerase